MNISTYHLYLADWPKGWRKPLHYHVMRIFHYGDWPVDFSLS